MRTARHAILVAAAIMALPAIAQTPAASPAPAAAPPSAAPPPTARSRTQANGPAQALKPCASVVVDPVTYLTLGKSRVIRLDFPAARVIVGGQGASRVGVPAAPAPGAPGGAAPAAPQAASDGVADTEISLLSPTELFFLGRKTGSMNVVLQSADGRCVVKDIVVTIDPDTLQAKLGELMPEEAMVKVRSAENAIVLTGSVTDLVKLDQV